MTDIQRAVVYVDGENFLHRVQDALQSDHHIEKKDDITHFRLRELLSTILPEAQSLDIRYYGTKIRVGHTGNTAVQERAKQMIESQRRLKRDLENQDIQFVTAGSLRVRDSTCNHCRQTTLVFKEKGVDVRCAVDIAEEASEATWQVIVSSDSDLLPAVHAAKRKGSHIVYVHYAEMPNFAMLKAANETRVFTKNQAQKAYEEAA